MPVLKSTSSDCEGTGWYSREAMCVQEWPTSRPKQPRGSCATTRTSTPSGSAIESVLVRRPCSDQAPSSGVFGGGFCAVLGEAESMLDSAVPDIVQGNGSCCSPHTRLKSGCV